MNEVKGRLESLGLRVWDIKYSQNGFYNICIPCTKENETVIIHLIDDGSLVKLSVEGYALYGNYPEIGKHSWNFIAKITD